MLTLSELALATAAEKYDLRGRVACRKIKNPDGEKLKTGLETFRRLQNRFYRLFHYPGLICSIFDIYKIVAISFRMLVIFQNVYTILG